MFEALKGKSYLGDIAIDDITMTPGSCSQGMFPKGGITLFLTACSQFLTYVAEVETCYSLIHFLMVDMQISLDVYVILICGLLDSC